MKSLKATLLLLSLALMVNVGHARQLLGKEIHLDPSGAVVVSPTNSLMPSTEYPHFNLGAGTILSISDASTSWSGSNRVLNGEVTLINGTNGGGTIQLISAGGLVITGSWMQEPSISLLASVVPEADDGMMLLLGLGLISVIVAKRSLK